MRLDCRDPAFVVRGLVGTQVLDCDAGRIISKVIWADDETGEYECYVTNAEGAIVIGDCHGNPIGHVSRWNYVEYNEWIGSVARPLQPLRRRGKARLRFLFPSPKAVQFL